MIDDDILREVRAAREAFAALHNYDIGAMLADLQARDLAGDWQVVSREPRPPIAIVLAPRSSVPETKQTEAV